ncbi:MAG: hypothetical protein AB7V13_16330 [Pseudorhodoplanes sp.]
MQVLAQLRQAAFAVRCIECDNRLRRHRPELGNRLAGTLPEHRGDILAEAHHVAVGHTRMEPESMGHIGCNDDRARRRKRLDRRLEDHLTAAALDDEDLKQIAMTMGADQPVMQ